MQCENISVCKWKDWRDIYTMSNMHRVVMVPTTNRKGYEKMKPNTVHDYNQYMSGIDHADQTVDLSWLSGKGVEKFCWSQRAKGTRIYICQLSLFDENTSHLGKGDSDAKMCEML